jgi:hypothetical protein
MSVVFTMAVLQTYSDQALSALFRQVQQDLVRSAAGSAQRRNALASLDNISRVRAQRQFRPRPPGF